MSSVYDIEIFPNMFLIVFKEWTTGTIHTFEISDRKSQRQELINFLPTCKRLIGFNNLAYDSNMLGCFEAFMHSKSMSDTKLIKTLFEHSQTIINAKFGDQYLSYKAKAEQWDLYKCWHYDNNAKRTSLKKLQISINWYNVLESSDNFLRNAVNYDKVVDYCINDVESTYEFAQRSMSKFRERKEIEKVLGVNCLNYSDSKLGESMFLQELCEEMMTDVSEFKERIVPIKAVRADTILIDFNYDKEQYQAIYNKIRQSTIYPVKEEIVYKGKKRKVKSEIDTSFMFQNVQIDIREGGIHGSDSGIFTSDNDWLIRDNDIGSMYPKTIVNLNIYPRQIGPLFSILMSQYYEERIAIKRQIKKLDEVEDKDVIKELNYKAARIKLSVNSSYGKMGSIYSPLYDPACVYKTTINGQLLIVKWLEMLSKIPTLQLIQVNTDGITCRFKREYEDQYNEQCRLFSEEAKFELESNDYKVIAIRDVNSYCCVSLNGAIKTKGEYVYEIDKKNPEYHKTINFQISRKAAVDNLLFGIPIVDTIQNCTDIFMFIASTRFKKPNDKTKLTDDSNEDENTYEIFQTSSKVVERSEAANGYYIGVDEVKHKTQAVTRFIYSKKGKTLWKYYVDGRISKMFEAKLLMDCNLITEESKKELFDTIDYDAYIVYANKLVRAATVNQLKMELL